MILKVNTVRYIYYIRNNSIKDQNFHLMNKFKTRKAIYNSIVRENRSHQETFDDLSQKTSCELKWLADEIAKYPSKSRNEQHKVLRYIYIGLLSLAIILRVVWTLSIVQFNIINNSAIVLLIALGVLIPLMGIIGSFKRNIQSYTSMAIISFINIFKSISYFENSDNPLLLIGLFPYVGIIILALYIPSQLKTPYKIEVMEEEGSTGVLISEKFIFEAPFLENDSDILDDLK